MTSTWRSVLATSSPQFVALEGGEFVMGNDAGASDERPAHPVRLRPFRAAIAPVTNAEYLRFVEETGVPSPAFIEDERFARAVQPAVGVSWFEAVAYCEWLSGHTRVRCRLPTEAEREFAARGPDRVLDWPWMGDAHPLAASLATLERPHEPAPECANGYGLRCMADNVHEWCSDWYDAGYYARCPLDAPAGPRAGRRRVARGGSWRHAVKFTRVTARASLDPSFRYNDFGFRLYADA